MPRPRISPTRHTVPLILAAILLWLCPLNAYGAVFHVDDDAPNDPGRAALSGSTSDPDSPAAPYSYTDRVAADGGRPTGQVVRIAIANEAELEALQALEALGRDFEVWSEVIAVGPIEVRVAPAAVAVLDASGLRYEVTVEDLQQHLDELFGGRRDGDFFDTLRTYDEHVQFMTDLVATYPDLAEMFVVGTSVLGRPMWALRITGPGGEKPGVMYHGAQHGNEEAGASVVAFTAHYPLTNYDSDPEVAA
ncbi:MAG: M14 family metallopeptidase [Planctomycetota bacterium]